MARHSGDGAEMVYVPVGEFLMGSVAGVGSDDEHPKRKVYPDGYWIDRCEVTNAQYGKFLEWLQRTGDHSERHNDEAKGKDHTPQFWSEARWNGATHPVVTVDWWDAHAAPVFQGRRLYYRTFGRLYCFEDTPGG